VLGTVPVTMTRSVTNVGAATATYTATATLSGFTTLVTPSSLTLAPGETKSFTLKLTNVNAPANVWNYGSLSWADGAGHVVRSPIQTMVGKAITAPGDQTSDRTAGSKLFPIQTGFSGAIKALKGGLKEVTLGAPVSLTRADMSQAQMTPVCLAGNDTASIKVYKFTVPANTAVARFQLRNADTGAPGQDDHDMLVMKSDGSNVVYSGNGASVESVQYGSPSAGTYHVCVLAYDTAASANGLMTHRLSSWVVTTADLGGNFVAAVPAKVVAGNNTTVGMSWSGLGAGKRYLGAAQFLDLNNAVQATTVLRVETAAAVPTSEVQKEVAVPKN
jgi:hypothetical protein